jgi:hypothetical protein
MPYRGSPTRQRIAPRRRAVGWLEEAEAIPGWMSPAELQWLHDEASKHQVVLEIGVWCGRSTLASSVCEMAYLYDKLVLKLEVGRYSSGNQEPSGESCDSACVKGAR